MDDALSHWYCAEDTACYFQENGVISPDDVNRILRSGMRSEKYIAFVRHIAFRIYIYNSRDDELANWYMAERLLFNGEWVSAITRLASIYDAEKGSSELVNMIRSSKVKNYYK